MRKRPEICSRLPVVLAIAAFACAQAASGEEGSAPARPPTAFDAAAIGGPARLEGEAAIRVAPHRGGAGRRAAARAHPRLLAEEGRTALVGSPPVEGRGERDRAVARARWGADVQGQAAELGRRLDPAGGPGRCTEGGNGKEGPCARDPATQECVGGDSCCPSNSNEPPHADWSCHADRALPATGANSGGGANPSGYGPANWNDGVDEAGCQQAGCSQCFGWVSNSTTPGAAWMEYSWPSPVQIGSMYVDANPCTGGGCYNGGRTFFSGEVQWWNGTSWVGVQSFTNNDGDIQMTFSPKMNTTKIRIYNMTAGAGCGQQSNTLVYEWYVYPGSSCTP